jgi:hypothetical protein
MKLSPSKKIITLSIFFFLNTLYSQNYSYDQFVSDSLEIIKTRLVSPQFKLDNRVAVYNGQALNINGFDIGVLLSNKLRVTLGYYGMSGTLKNFNKTKEGIDYTRLIDMNYGSLNTELIYKDWRFFSLGMPFEIAAGVNKLSEKNVTANEIYATQTAPLLFFNFGISGTFKPMRFIGLKGILGYRKIAYNGARDFDFNGFFTSIGLNFDIREGISDIKMFRLKKRYHRGNNLSNAVNILTD